MVEALREGADARGQLLQAMKGGARLSLEGAAVAQRGRLAMRRLTCWFSSSSGLCSGAEGEQEHRLDAVAVRGHPGLHRLGVVDLEMSVRMMLRCWPRLRRLRKVRNSSALSAPS